MTSAINVLQIQSINPLCPGVLVALIKETKIFFVEIKKNKQHNL